MVYSGHHELRISNITAENAIRPWSVARLGCSPIYHKVPKQVLSATVWLKLLS
ncbi:hypothetical protein [Vibrio sp. 10N.261.51.F12]|uniref:hypothetical protein n=1 Tax=Vibrio sp. 10N.261.51.F12 TaxID=3229679 RepID=UPI0035574037